MLPLPLPLQLALQLVLGADMRLHLVPECLALSLDPLHTLLGSLLLSSQLLAQQLDLSFILHKRKRTQGGRYRRAMNLIKCDTNFLHLHVH